MSLPHLSSATLAARVLTELGRTLDTLVDPAARADLALHPGPGHSAWDPTRLREVHRRAVTVLRRFDELEIAVDARGRPLRFRSRERMAAPLAGATLTSDDKLRIARTSGLVAEGARIAEEGTSQGLSVIVVEQAPWPVRTRFVLHPDLQVIASFEVLEGPGAPSP